MRGLLLSLALVLAGCPIGCSDMGCGTPPRNQMGTSPSQNHVLTAKEAGKSQEVKIGVLLAVELGGKPSTGYDWKYQGGGNDIVLSLGDPEFRILGPAENVEQDARYTFRFRAARIGVSTLIFRYARPWEKDGDSERLSFPIRVVQ